MIDYDPQTVDTLKGRYAQALAFVYDAEKLHNANAIRPGEVAENVFDFTDGVRLIISREKHDITVLHLSGSMRPHSETWCYFTSRADEASRHHNRDRAMVAMRSIRVAFAAEIMRHFDQISGQEVKQPDHIHWAENGVPHFIWNEVQKTV